MNDKRSKSRGGDCRKKWATVRNSGNHNSTKTKLEGKRTTSRVRSPDLDGVKTQKTNMSTISHYVDGKSKRIDMAMNPYKRSLRQSVDSGLKQIYNREAQNVAQTFGKQKTLEEHLGMLKANEVIQRSSSPALIGNDQSYVRLKHGTNMSQGMSVDVQTSVLEKEIADRLDKIDALGKRIFNGELPMTPKSGGWINATGDVKSISSGHQRSVEFRSVGRIEDVQKQYPISSSNQSVQHLSVQKMWDKKKKYKDKARRYKQILVQKDAELFNMAKDMRDVLEQQQTQAQNIQIDTQKREQEFEYERTHFMDIIEGKEKRVKAIEKNYQELEMNLIHLTKRPAENEILAEENKRLNDLCNEIIVKLNQKEQEVIALKEERQDIVVHYEERMEKYINQQEQMKEEINKKMHINENKENQLKFQHQQEINDQEKQLKNMNSIIKELTEQQTQQKDLKEMEYKINKIQQENSKIKYKYNEQEQQYEGELQAQQQKSKQQQEYIEILYNQLKKWSGMDNKAQMLVHLLQKNFNRQDGRVDPNDGDKGSPKQGDSQSSYADGLEEYQQQF